MPQSILPPAPPGPPGLVMFQEAPEEEPEHAGYIDPRHDPNRPANAHQFFGIYFAMTGLHGVHVIAGMIVIAWLLARSIKGDFGSKYFTPVDLGGLYWHLVDVIWIFLYPLLYLRCV